MGEVDECVSGVKFTLLDEQRTEVLGNAALGANNRAGEGRKGRSD